MLKLYKVDEGQILIDGKNIDELDLQVIMKILFISIKMLAYLIKPF